MDVLIKIILIGITATFLAVFMKKESPAFSLAVILTAGIALFFIVSDLLSYSVMAVKTLFIKSGADSEILENVLKICGVGIVSEYFCNIIADAGEEGLAKKIELAAKTVIFAMTLPVILGVIDSIWGFM